MKRIFLSVAVATVALGYACSKSESPAAPSTAAQSSASAAADGSTLKIGAPALVSPVNGVQSANSDSTLLTVGNVSPTYSPNVAITFEVEIRNDAGTVVANPKFAKAGGDTTSFSLTTQLVADKVHSWRSRATSGTLVGPWSATATFKSAVGEGIFGNKILDPLTNGKTYGVQRGGKFIPGQGWQSTTTTDVIDYNIPSCTSCVFEFDITNIGGKEGECCNADLKFVSMGEGPAMNDFGSFRDSPWKMHFIQRADFANGLEIVWRNGGTDADGGNPGDHRIKLNDGGPDFVSTQVGHWRLEWDKDGYNISGSQNGGPLVSYLTCGREVEGVGACNDDGFHGAAYNVPNFRIELGCFPRAESFIGAIYRNIKLTPQ